MSPLEDSSSMDMAEATQVGGDPVGRSHSPIQRRETVGLLSAGDGNRFTIDPAMDVLDRNTSEEGENPSKEDSKNEDYPRAIVTASATAGGLVGCVVGGIGCALVAALATTYAANKKQGTLVGDAARSMGEVMLVAHDKVVALDAKHKIVHGAKESVQQTADQAWTKCKDMEQHYKVGERTQEVIDYTKQAAYSKTQAVCDYAHSVTDPVVERSMESVRSGCEYLGSKVGVKGASDHNRGNFTITDELPAGE